jgi:hypothetical protein
MKPTAFLLVFMVNIFIAKAQHPPTLRDTLNGYFNEIKTATKNGQKIWARDLYGPILLVNPTTRQIFANHRDSAGLLKEEAGIYTGTLPPEVNIANTSINWSGERWAMIMLPLPLEKSARINLIAHELFHKDQPTLGFELFNPNNNHLDLKNGRIYLRLELAALQKAILATRSSETKLHVKNALSFRKYRHSIYPGADSSENALELNEGLAEYTGLIMADRNKANSLQHFKQSLTDFEADPGFVRSFAYQTIPMYGYLLHAIKPNWNSQINVTTNLTNYFIKAFAIALATDIKNDVELNAAQYNSQSITTEEITREEKINALIAAYKNRFINQTHFNISFEQMNVSFDPRNIIPIGDNGTVYPNIRVTDNWGILIVENGALMSPNWDMITVSAPTINGLQSVSGDGWKLVLNQGYAVVKDENSHNFKLLKK